MKRGSEVCLQENLNQTEADRRKTKDAIAYQPAPGGQTDFWALVHNTPPDVRWVYLRGGTGSGKTSTAIAWFVERRKLEPLAPSLITANSFPQLSRSTLVALAKYCIKYNVPLEPTGPTPEDTGRIIARQQYCKIHGAYVFVVSMENFSGESESNRGLEAVDILIDECAYAKKEEYETVDTRLGRGFTGKLGKGLGVMCSSPNKRHPYNFMYELFDSPDRNEELKKRYVSVHASSEDNPHLPPNYCSDLKARYSPELYIIEVLGKYAATTEGKIFKHFDQTKHVLNPGEIAELGYSYDPRLDIHLSQDFNWNPATCIAAQIRNENEIIILKEWRLENSDTFEISERIAEWLKQSGQSRAVHLHGDASGNSRSANSKKTNWQIVNESLRKHGFGALIRRRYAAKNPEVLDTVLTVNNLFAQEQSRLYISSECGWVIKDLQQLRWNADGTGIEKAKDSSISHLGDCVRYLCWDIAPFKRHQDGPQHRADKGVPGLRG